MKYKVLLLVLLLQVYDTVSQYFYPGYGYHSGHFGYHSGSFGHGHFQSPKAYPPLPRKFTIADELKYGPKFNQRFLNQFRFPGYPEYSEFFRDESVLTESTQRPQTSTGIISDSQVMTQLSTGDVTTTTTTPASSEATTEDEDKVVADAPDRDCPSGQMRSDGECRDIA
ncbi:uncharacterized protein LOC128988743 isoform X2 [Macrosteles quadrilineatus]|uniref:uncharacterized protein LOC128988743 isoform X2 n=1 Tax=Macrosteles quadrilineatus TaxID=74068 RepID=UPI0023E2367A|nr:uncharacterized protein LOC128988743 isoform X2 [Macrosteles quadrilineatus]